MTELDDLADGAYTAVVDAVEDGLATVFFEDDGDEVGDALVDDTDLPAEGCHPDAVLTVTVVDGEVVDWEYDRETTEQRREAAQSRFDRLSERAPSDDDT